MKTGHRVIVQADKGPDLRTVAHEKMRWFVAADRKEYQVKGRCYLSVVDDPLSPRAERGPIVHIHPNALPNPVSTAQTSAAGGMSAVGQSHPRDS